MPLEPSDENLREMDAIIERVLYDDVGTYRRVWAYVRDAVLEEAAKRCDSRAAAIVSAQPHSLGREHNETAAKEAGMCALMLRALKGGKP